jgi:tellurite resistance protein TehA-like permease
MFIGPMGQGSSALIQLGRAAQVYGAFDNYNTSTFLSAEAAAPVHAVSVMIALILSGLGVIWVGFGVYAMLRRAARRELVWTHAWNSIIFPTGTLVTSMELFALEMDSVAFRVIATIMLVMLVIVFLTNLIFVVSKIWRRELLIIRDNPRMEQKQE